MFCVDLLCLGANDEWRSKRGGLIMTRVVICDMPYKYSKERDVCLFLCLSRLFLTFLSEGDGCTACSIVCLPKTSLQRYCSFPSTRCQVISSNSEIRHHHHSSSIEHRASSISTLASYHQLPVFSRVVYIGVLSLSPLFERCSDCQ